MFSGLVTQSEIDRLLDELYGDPSRVSSNEAEVARVRTAEEHRPLLVPVRADPNRESWKSTFAKLGQASHSEYPSRGRKIAKRLLEPSSFDACSSLHTEEKAQGGR